MAAAIVHVEPIADRDLLGGLHAVADRLAVLQPDAAALVQREFGVDQVAVVFQQPLNAERVGVQNLLVGLQRQDDVAIGLVAFLLVADHVGDEGRRHELVVAAAARVIIAVLLDQLERIERPVLAPGRHHVEMRQQQDRLARAACRAAARPDCPCAAPARTPERRLPQSPRRAAGPPSPRPPAWCRRSRWWCRSRPVPCRCRRRAAAAGSALPRATMRGAAAIKAAMSAAQRRPRSA